MNTEVAGNDLMHIREVLERTRSRIDPHAWQFVLRGTIVLLWYPTHNLMQLNGLIPGPCMGLEMIVPGVISERRVRRIRAKESRDDDA